MTAYDQIINREASDDPFVPEPVSSQIIQDMPHSSAVLQRAARVTMSSKTQRQPVLSAFPTAYFLSSDTGLKKTSVPEWENLSLVAEELAVIVPIPNAYFDDSQIPIWNEVRPRVAEAFGKVIDLACLFGINKPSTWGDAVVPGAVAAGNLVLAGTTDDLAADVALVAQQVAEDGFAVNGFATAPGFRWRLVGLRSADGIPIYAPPAGDQPGTLYGFPVSESLNGGFGDDEADLIAGDWTKAVLGIRQDMTFEIFTEGVISDESGNVVLNLMQQDSKALRVVMRLGWQVANPVTATNDDDDSRFPFGVLTSGAS